VLRRLLFIVLAVLAVFVWLRRLVPARRRPAARRATPEVPAAGGEMVRDRVCNTFLPRSRALTLQVGSGEEFFCSEQCRRTFQERLRASS